MLISLWLISPTFRIRNSTGLHFNRTLYFDHEDEDTWDLLNLGITCMKVKNCVSMATVTSILRIFSGPGVEVNETEHHSKSPHSWRYN